MIEPRPPVIAVPPTTTAAIAFSSRPIPALLGTIENRIAFSNAAKKFGTPAGDSTVRALVSLNEDDQGGYRLTVELHAVLPGIDRAQAQRIMDEAHKTCPYSKALRGDTSVKLVVDELAEPAAGLRKPSETVKK